MGISLKKIVIFELKVIIVVKETALVLILGIVGVSFREEKILKNK